MASSGWPVCGVDLRQVLGGAAVAGVELDGAAQLGERGAAGARVGGRLAEQRPAERRAVLGLVGHEARGLAERLDRLVVAAACAGARGRPRRGRARRVRGRRGARSRSRRGRAGVACRRVVGAVRLLGRSPRASDRASAVRRGAAPDRAACGAPRRGVRRSPARAGDPRPSCGGSDRGGSCARARRRRGRSRRPRRRARRPGPEVVLRAHRLATIESWPTDERPPDGLRRRDGRDDARGGEGVDDGRRRGGRGRAARCGQARRRA